MYLKIVNLKEAIYIKVISRKKFSVSLVIASRKRYMDVLGGGVKGLVFWNQSRREKRWQERGPTVGSLCAVVVKGNKWVQQADNNILMYRVCVCVLYKGSGIPELFIIFIIQRGN